MALIKSCLASGSAVNIQQFATPTALTGIPVTVGKHYVIFTGYYTGDDTTTISGANVITSYAGRQDNNTGYQYVFIIEATSSSISITGSVRLNTPNTRIAQLD